MSPGSTATHSFDAEMLGGLLTDDAYWPTAPQELSETGLGETFVEALLLKIYLSWGTISGRKAAELVGLPFRIIEQVLDSLRTRKLIVHVRDAAFNDYYYSLTEAGLDRAGRFMAQSAYAGVAPVLLSDYVLSVQAQAAGIEPVDQDQLRQALADISYETALLDQLGPAINSNGGLFLFGPPGNGKTTIARAMTACLGQEIWIPRVIFDDGNLIKLQDDAFHVPTAIPDGGDPLLESHSWDRRWVRIQRPTVTVGGELTMDNLEVRHDGRSNLCEAPLQMKSNCGCLLIDDFGRQRIAPEELLNRWIVPLENHCDFLTLPSGKKIQVPFEQLIIFSTNIQPAELVDEAFLRRVPYKIFVADPSPEEYRQLFQAVCRRLQIPYVAAAVDHLLAWYQKSKRPMRRCHPRDLLQQVRNICTYRQLPIALRPELLDRAWQSYFSQL